MFAPLVHRSSDIDYLLSKGSSEPINHNSSLEATPSLLLFLRKGSSRRCIQSEPINHHSSVEAMLSFHLYSSFRERSSRRLHASNWPKTPLFI